MITRDVKNNEYKKVDELFSIAFNLPLDPPGDNEEDKEPDDWRVASFLDDDTTMTSCIYIPFFEMNFDGSMCKMAGIGGVSTPPQYRRNGGIRACFDYALPKMYEKGMDFSYLYPFSTAYYRKFGYENCCDMEVYKIRLEHIPFFKTKGQIYMIDETNRDKAVNDVKKVYSCWEKRYNCMTAPTEDSFEWVTKASPLQGTEYNFVYKNESGIATGYMRVATDIGTERNLCCRQFVFEDIDALKAMLGLLRTYAADFLHVSINMPRDTNLEHVLPEWSFGAVSRTLYPFGMIRVINAESVLKKASYKGSGEFVICLKDEKIAENNGAFKVTYKEGEDTVVSKLSLEPSENYIKMDISLFSSLIAGARTLTEAMFMGDIEGDFCVDDFDNVFYRKPMYIMASF
ncbi:MAG: GNAT family N-acetyltransferase [Lachnospiraceae bacterium]|nr:GNAT family N-acetyltransferase [Lachnospiraceae bacterium]